MHLQTSASNHTFCTFKDAIYTQTSVILARNVQSVTLVSKKRVLCRDEAEIVHSANFTSSFFSNSPIN